jgi:hypothetical protein
MVNFTPYKPSANQRVRIGSPHYGTPAIWVLSGPAGADGADTHSWRTRYFSLGGFRLGYSALLLELVVVNGEREVVSQVGHEGARTLACAFRNGFRKTRSPHCSDKFNLYLTPGVVMVFRLLRTAQPAFRCWLYLGPVASSNRAIEAHMLLLYDLSIEVVLVTYADEYEQIPVQTSAPRS